MKEITEAKIQQECWMWFNNNYCLKHHKPRCFMFSIANELGFYIGRAIKEITPQSLHKRIDEIIFKLIDKFKKTGFTSGVSDTIVMMNRKLIFVEIKTEKGIQSKEQKEFQSRVESLGFEYHLIRSLNEFQNLIQP